MNSFPLILRDADILGGIPVFAGTRVPVKTLFDYLKSNHPLADFLDDFPTVREQHAKAVLEMVATKAGQVEETVSEDAGFVG